MVNVYINLCEKCGKGAVYNIKGGTPKYCKNHKTDDMIDLINICAQTNCYETPLYNITGTKKGQFCENHKLPGMIIVGRCASPGCTSLPSYNTQGLPPKYCKQHTTAIDMVDVISKKCKFDKCSGKASYGFSTKTHCPKHKLEGMLNMKSKCRYNGCSTQPSYNFPLSTGVKFCVLHKLDGMVNIYAPKCEFVNNGETCDRPPTYNVSGSLRGKFCGIHKQPDMVNVHDKLCEYNGCKKQPAYNLPGMKTGRFCSSHKEDKMINIKQIYCECGKIAYYNDTIGQRPKYCVDHRLPNMIQVANISRKCESCNKIPIYGFPGEKSRFCTSHKLPGMVNLSGKKCATKNCLKSASYGYLFSKVSHCFTHKSPNMLPKLKINPKCVECKAIAYYCDAKLQFPTRCETHKLNTDINIVEKPCIICGLSYFIPGNQDKCTSCSEYQNPTIRNSKELRIKDVLNAANIKYKSHDTIPDFACSRYRPDFIIEVGLFDIIIEVDENQHKSYACECEIGRMIQLHQDFGGIPLIFIRYNPDNYKDNIGTLVKGYQHNKDREKLLIELIIKLLDKQDRVDPLSVIYLFYDGFDSTIKVTNLDYFNHSAIELADSL
jgi:hypothetical protein